ncbi:MAG: erythromycin esterase family protein [bacterium]|nr:erythromycin esterase family protein [bacterium]
MPSTRFLCSAPLWLGLISLVARASMPAPAAGQEIQPGIHRLNGIEETLPIGDLKPLKKIVRDIDVLGLGEDVHTTRGFSRAKFRLFKYLVEKRGFRAFGFESPWVEAELVARYVEDCQGSPESALQGLFGVWQNESVRDLVQWMCEYNRKHAGDPVYFYGFDHQQGWDDAPRLRSLLRQFGVDANSRKIRWLDNCEGGSSTSAGDYFANRQTPIPELRHERCLDALDRDWEFLDRRARRLIRKGRATAEDIEWARIHIVGLRSWQEQTFHRDTSFSRSYEARDLGMAYIARMIRELRFPAAKTALWAHNGHIAAGGKFLTGPDTMGVFLKESLGDKYEALGLVAYESKIDWPGVGCGSTGVSRFPSVEASLRQFDELFLFIDLDFPDAEDPFLVPNQFYSLNGNFMVPREEFRALIYLETAEKMIPLAWEPCSE